ncbi:hypothetical protein TWF730_005407 [Orbilia blumenaviensis]|uniref:Uncharacterized protein n=1 Tax=Orbilia blumenaviensis TaxID=1796055 RepID=A0AAV9VKH3_9PEZI
MRWDSTADAKLFMAVLKVHSLKLNTEAIAKLMGDGCTAKAVSHRITKLRGLGGDLGSKPSKSTPNTPTKSTPTKRKRSDKDDLLAVKMEHVERTLDSDASSETYNIDAVTTGSPKKRRRQQKFPVAQKSTAVSNVSFASTHIDADHSPPTTASFYDSSEQQSPFAGDYLHASFDPVTALGEHLGTGHMDPLQFMSNEYYE